MICVGIDRQAELGGFLPGFTGYGTKKTTVVNNYHAPPMTHAGQPSWYDNPPYWIVNPPPWITMPPPWMNMPPGFPAHTPSPGFPTAPEMPQQPGPPAPTWRERFFGGGRPANPTAPPPEIPVAIDPALVPPTRIERFRRAFAFKGQPGAGSPGQPDTEAMQEVVAQTEQKEEVIAQEVAKTQEQEQVIAQEVGQLEQQTAANTMNMERLEQLLNDVLAKIDKISYPGANLHGPAAPAGSTQTT